MVTGASNDSGTEEKQLAEHLKASGGGPEKGDTQEQRPREEVFGGGCLWP